MLKRAELPRMPNTKNSHSLLPNLFIGGAQKSGTSTLHQLLAHHPQCLMSEPKEPYVFSQNQTPFHSNCYHKLFPSQSDQQTVKIVGESSTTYLSLPEIAERIDSSLGTDIRFIFVLRNPSERAMSAYWHMKKRFHESRIAENVFGAVTPNLDEELDNEEREIRLAERSSQIVTKGYEKKLGDRYWPFRYLRNSCYLDDLREFEARFGADKLLILLTDDLSAKPEQVAQQIVEFLGLSQTFSPNTLQARLNITRVPPQNRVSKMLASVIPKCPPLVAASLRRLIDFSSRPAPQTPESVRERLRALFRSHNDELSQYLRRDLCNWN